MKPPSPQAHHRCTIHTWHHHQQQPIIYHQHQKKRKKKKQPMVPTTHSGKPRPRLMASLNPHPWQQSQTYTSKPTPSSPMATPTSTTPPSSITTPPPNQPICTDQPPPHQSTNLHRSTTTPSHQSTNPHRLTTTPPPNSINNHAEPKPTTAPIHVATVS